jgi:hypothetical protein
MTSIWRSMWEDRSGFWIVVGYAVVALGLAVYVIASERASRLGGVLLEQRILSQEIKR